MFGRKRKVYTALIGLEKAYHETDWEAMWDILSVDGIYGKLSDGVSTCSKMLMHVSG